jgi:hypothetical protein
MGYSFLDLAKDVLGYENIPLSVEEMWEAGNKHALLRKLSSSGKTPIRTLSARLYVDIKNNENSIFTQVSNRPAKFFLKNQTAGLQEYEEQQEQTGKKLTYSERDLHVLLSSFVNSEEHF